MTPVLVAGRWLKAALGGGARSIQEAGLACLVALRSGRTDLGWPGEAPSPIAVSLTLVLALPVAFDLVARRLAGLSATVPPAPEPRRRPQRSGAPIP